MASPSSDSPASLGKEPHAMLPPTSSLTPHFLRCAIYTRKSSEEGLEQDFNSLDAQREACEAFAFSQKMEGWSPVSETYDDGGFSGGNVERPPLGGLLRRVRAGRIGALLVYKPE